MTPNVCQGVQSCLEPRLIEPRVLRHKLAPPKSCSPHSFPWPQTEHPKNSQNEGEDDRDFNSSISSTNGDLGGWSFILALTNTPQNGTQVTDHSEKAYEHPRVKPSPSALSSKSLEMCTESLGSESSNDFSPLSSENYTSQRSKTRGAKKLAPGDGGGFPPPLTSIRCSNGVVQVRPHREAGRLVIKAVTVSSWNTCFRAERVDGRLRLCLVKESSVSAKCEGDEEVAERVVEEYDDDDEGDGEGGDVARLVGDMGGNSGNLGVKLRLESFAGVGANGCQVGSHFELPLLKAVC